MHPRWGVDQPGPSTTTVRVGPVNARPGSDADGPKRIEKDGNPA